MSITAFFEPRKQSMVDVLTACINLESPSHDKQAVDRFGNYLEQQMQQHGAAVERHPRSEVGDILLGKWNASAAAKPLLILAHMDTVWKIGRIQERPVAIDAEGRLFGPGAVDMKGGIVLALDAIAGLAERGELPDRPIWLMLTSDEEIGSQHSREIIESSAQQAELVLVMEPPTGDGALKTWRKGVASYTMTIEGKAAHAGNEPEMGVNAVIEFAQQALELNRMNDLKNGTSVSVTRVEGGTATNVIPAHTVAHIDTRMLTMQAYNRLYAEIMNRAPFIPGARVSMTANHFRPPMERNGAVFERARTLAAAQGITIREDGAGGGSDGNFTAALGIPTLDGLGAEGAGLHAEHEHILVSSLPRRAALLATLLRDW
jgi:glutamate carboxypeptidase